MFDVVESLDDRFGRKGGSAPSAEVPLEEADPENEVGDSRGAGIQLDAFELVGIDGKACLPQALLSVTETFKGVVDLSLEALQVFEGNVEEIAGAAGGIEDFQRAEAAAEFEENVDCVRSFASALQGERGSLDIGPVAAKRFDDGGDDEPFDIRPWSIVRSQSVTLAFVQGALQKGAKDGWLHVFPFGDSGEAEDVELTAIEREGFDGFEEAAVKVQDVLAQNGGKPPECMVCHRDSTMGLKLSRS